MKCMRAFACLASSFHFLGLSRSRSVAFSSLVRNCINVIAAPRLLITFLLPRYSILHNMYLSRFSGGFSDGRNVPISYYRCRFIYQ